MKQKRLVVIDVEGRFVTIAEIVDQETRRLHVAKSVNFDSEIQLVFDGLEFRDARHLS